MEKNKKIIYIAEDDVLMIRIYERLFKMSGFEVEIAADGEEAIQKLKSLKEPPSLFILDIMMPKLSGFDVLAFIKQNQVLKSVPVVMFTNLSSEDDAKKSADMGALLYLIKSEYSPKEIVQKIQEVIV